MTEGGWSLLGRWSQEHPRHRLDPTLRVVDRPVHPKLEFNVDVEVGRRRLDEDIRATLDDLVRPGYPAQVLSMRARRGGIFRVAVRHERVLASNDCRVVNPIVLDFVKSNLRAAAEDVVDDLPGGRVRAIRGATRRRLRRPKMR